MPPTPAPVTATHPAFAQFRTALQNLQTLHVSHETGIRSAFQALLQTLAGEQGLTLVTEQPVEGTRIRPDGTLRDAFNLPRGYWESKDTKDDLEVEINKKRRKGYPFTNIIFEDSQRVVLYQNNKPAGEALLDQAAPTAALLHQFLTYQEPDPTSFENAMLRFGEIIPALATGLIERIDSERKENARFAVAFTSLFDLCRDTLNPQIQPAVVVEMLAQHLLTERLFRTIFDNPDFVRRNIIAQEVEKTIEVMVGRQFNRADFTRTLDKYYVPIEGKARESSGWEQKQTFLNSLYERFFQDFSRKDADTQGIVYTPQPIVNFMLASVDALLKSEFGTSLSSEGVHILDPCVGTGNFIQNLLRRLSPLTLTHKYQHELFCNENMLLPYYIASLNIEHAFYERAGEYAAFPGLCFTDTLLLENQFAGADATGSLDFFSEQNAERVRAEQAAPITVIIGNPPYNVGQTSENDNNKNRTHSTVGQRLSATYVRDSRATSTAKVSDMYVRFFRWATDRLQGEDGVIAFVSNNGFLANHAFDGMRKGLADDFTDIYIVDLGGNSRKGGGGSVFGIRVGVCITFLVRRSANTTKQIKYYAVDDALKAEAKLQALTQAGSITSIEWQTITPDSHYHWLNEGMQEGYEDFLPLGTKEAKGGGASNAIFTLYSLGVATHRDDVVYDFDRAKLEARVKDFIAKYNSEVSRWSALRIPPGQRTAEQMDGFVDYNKIKWSETLKASLRRGLHTEYDESHLRKSMYRPFSERYFYFDPILNDRRYQQQFMFPTAESATENICLVISDVAHRAPFSVLAVNQIPDLHMLASVDGFQCFPFYVYDADGTNRRENITDDALAAFQTHHADPALTKPDIFAYIYALLHHPDYRTRYRENLKRELPRIPFAPDPATFRALAQTGAALLALHTGYETAPEYPLTDDYDPQATLAEVFHVVKMALNKEKDAVRVNPSLTLRGIPPSAHDYKLGSRSALDWVIDQYRIKGDSDPNRAADPQYIVRLVKRVVTVSVETVRLVGEMPGLGF